jgi:hypothetical protein
VRQRKETPPVFKPIAIFIMLHAAFLASALSLAL